MITKSTRTLQILASVGAVLYFLIVAMIVFYDSYPIFKPLGLKEILLLIFIAGIALSWMNNKMAAGMLFMFWNSAVWIDDLYLNRPEMDYSMASAMATSFMVIGTFFLLDWYKTFKAITPSKQQQWKFILRVLLINYAVLYAIVVLSELFVGEQINYLSFPYIIYPLLFLIFWLGFFVSWKSELYAGYIYLIWFALLLYANIAIPEVLKLGPWAAFGISLLVQGIFYLRNHYKFRPK